MVCKPDFSSHSGPDALSPDGKEARGIMQQEKRLLFSNLPLLCLKLSRSHRKENPTGPPQVVICPGFLS
jgi:hypothetical protein